MSKTKKTIYTIITFVCVALLGSVLYGEKLGHENTQKELQKIVLQDLAKTEVFLKQNPVSMRRWADYLTIEQGKYAITHPTKESTNDLILLLTTLKFANGAEKYPAFMNLRESLHLLLDWQKSNFLQTAFQNQHLLAAIASSRRSTSETTAENSLIKITQKLDLEQRRILEKKFQNQMQKGLLYEFPVSDFAGNLSQMPALSRLDVSSPEAEQPVSEASDHEKATKPRRSKLYNKLQQKHSETEKAETNSEEKETEPLESTSQNDVLSSTQSVKPFILSKTPSLMDFMAREKEKKHLNSIEKIHSVLPRTPFWKDVMIGNISETAPKQLADALESQSQVTEKPVDVSKENSEKVSEEKPEKDSEDSQPVPQRESNVENSESELTVPELDMESLTSEEDSSETTPGFISGIEDLQNFLDDSIPEAETGNSSSEKSDRYKIENIFTRKESNQSVQLKPFTNRIPGLPFLHYSLEQSVGNAPAIPRYDGPETIDDLLNTLEGDFSKDLQTVRKCWLLEKFQIPNEEDLAAAYENIQNAFNDFSKTMKRLDEKKRQSWFKLLHLESLNLNQKPQLDVLQDIYRQLSNGNAGLELNIFVNFRESIKYFLTLVSIKNEPEKAEEMFVQARNRIVKLLEIVEKDHSSVIERALEDELNWFEIVGQAEQTVEATRRMWTKPNLIGHAAASIFERYGTRAVQEEEKISNRIQRASIYGTCNFNGCLVMKPVLNPDRIELEVVLDGSSDARTRAYAGPAIISSRAKSRVLAEKKIFFDESGFSTNNAKVNIRTNSQIQDVQDIRNRQFIENLATRRAFARKEQTESEATAQSSMRLRARFNRQINDAIKSWNTQMAELVRVHFRSRGLELQNTHTWSDDAGAHGQTLFSCRYGMGAYSDPPQVPQPTDFQFAIHETVLQGAFAGFLGGLNMDSYARKHLKETVPSFLKKSEQNSDSEKKEKSNEEDWAMRFPKDWPISISIQDGKLCCVIHSLNLEVNKKSYPAVDISIMYNMELREDGIHFVRQEEIDILPPDFNPDSSDRLPASMVSLRRVMGKRLQETFVEEIVLKEQQVMKNPTPDSQFANVYIKPIFIQAKDGWLQVGMNLYEKK